MRPRLRTLFLVILTAGAVQATAAQRGQDAGLVGTVRDSTGSVIARARVTVSSETLIGGPRSVLTGADGSYQLAFLPPGAYDIRVESSGLATARRTAVPLSAGLTFTVDFTLAVADVAQSVEVVAPAPAIDVLTSASPTVVHRTLLENLPLPRRTAELVNLAPGVVRDVAFGGTLYANPLALDGTSANEPGFGTPVVSPNLHWIEELQVISIGADAQYGEFSGVLGNAVSRSGSNRFSGLAEFWTTRPGWTADNRQSLSPALQARFRPIEIKRRHDTSLAVGGPLRRDRLWFFGGLERYRDVNRPTTFNVSASGPGTANYDSVEWQAMGKLTAAPTRSLRVDGYLLGGRLQVDGANTSPLTGPEALALLDRNEAIWSVRALWTLAAHAVVEIRHNGNVHDSYTGPADRNRGGPAPRRDQLTGVLSVNAPSFSEWRSNPLSTGAHLTYLVPRRWAGRHEFRAGLEHERATLRTAEGYPGGMLFQDYGGLPDQVVLWAGATNRPTQHRLTGYLQDAWQPIDRLTVNAGVRLGLYRGSVPGRAKAFSATSASPRLGVAFDATRDHRTAIRLHYGRYHDAMVTSFYDFLDPLSQSPTIFATVDGSQFVETFRTPTPAQISIDPALKYPYVEELVAGIDREIPLRMSVTAQYIGREFNSSIGFADPGLAWAAVERADPGPDGRRGTADDGGAQTVFDYRDGFLTAPVLTNPEGAYRSYRGIQLVVRRPHSHRLNVQASYTWSRTVGSYNNGASSNAANGDLGLNGVFVNPNRRINAAGRTPQDFTHELKALGTIRLKLWGELILSGIYRYQSGSPWGRTAGGFGPRTGVNAILLEPRGTRVTPAVNSADLRIQKTFTWNHRASPGLFLDVFNVWNQGIALRVVAQSGPNFGVPLLWMDPRTIRAGIRVSF